VKEGKNGGWTLYICMKVEKENLSKLFQQEGEGE
jgi:hypothetical protein